MTNPTGFVTSARRPSTLTGLARFFQAGSARDPRKVLTDGRRHALETRSREIGAAERGGIRVSQRPQFTRGDERVKRLRRRAPNERLALPPEPAVDELILSLERRASVAG